MPDFYTIGHGRHALPAFSALLTRHAATPLADVRAARSPGLEGRGIHSWWQNS